VLSSPSEFGRNPADKRIHVGSLHYELTSTHPVIRNSITVTYIVTFLIIASYKYSYLLTYIHAYYIVCRNYFFAFLSVFWSIKCRMKSFY